MLLETVGSYEVYAVDNGSTDGSARLYVDAGAMVVSLDRNANYSEAMNFGSQFAKGEYLCHINNDVVVSPNWDEALIAALEASSADFVCPSSLEFMPDWATSKRLMRRWRRITSATSAQSKEDLEALLWRMYGDYAGFCRRFIARFGGRGTPGINGHTVLMRRESWGRLGGYDERMLATDWDLYMTTATDVDLGLRPPVTVGSCFVHHFMGATTRTTQAVYEDAPGAIRFATIQDKWPIDSLKAHWPVKLHLSEAPRLRSEPVRYARYALKRMLGLYSWGDEW